MAIHLCVSWEKRGVLNANCTCFCYVVEDVVLKSRILLQKPTVVLALFHSATL